MKYAYTTIITKEDYLPCAIKNAQRMRYLGCKYPYHILISNSLRENEKIPLLIKESNIKISFFEETNYHLLNHRDPSNQVYFENKTTMYNTLNKFEILTLTEYEIVMFLDADTILKTNLDSVFIEKNMPSNYHFICDLVKARDVFNEPNCYTFHAPSGQLFLCKPDKQLYIWLKNILYKYTYEDDEVVLFVLFFNEILYPHKRLVINSDYQHFNGRLKLYNMNYFFIKYLFNSTTAHEFNILYDKYFEKLDKINTYSSNIDIDDISMARDIKLL